MQVVERVHGRVGALPENLAGALAYLTILPALIFLFAEPYRRNLFIRFHSLQCFLFTAAAILMALALRLAGMALFVIPVLGPLLVAVIDGVAALAVVLVWVVLIIKAFQGDTFKLSILGDFAEEYAGRF